MEWEGAGATPLSAEFWSFGGGLVACYALNILLPKVVFCNARFVSELSSGFAACSNTTVCLAEFRLQLCFSHKLAAMFFA